MIIDFSLSPSVLEGINRLVLEERVSAIVRTHRRGHNLVVFERMCGLWLLKNLVLIGRDKAMLTRLVHESPQSRGLPRSALHVIEIASPGTGVFRLNARVVRVAIDDAFLDDILGRPIFIVEDINSDDNVYKFLFQNFPDRFFSASFSYEVLHGGGEGITRVAEAKANERRIIVAAYDSDKDSPVSSSPKQRVFTKLSSKNSWPLFFHFCLPCREIENVIPLDVYKLKEELRCSPACDILLVLNEMDKFVGNLGTPEQFWLWFDVKKGLTREKIAKISDPAVVFWIEEKISRLYPMKVDLPIPGFGPGSLKDILSTPDTVKSFRLALNSETWLTVFRNMIVEMLWIFAAPQPTRI